MTELLLVRHGETDWNAEGKLQGHTDRPLNAYGRRQAQTLADSFAGDSIDALADEPVGEGLCLPSAVVVQRPICVTLQLPLGVPIGLAVANEQQLRHLHLG